MRERGCVQPGQSGFPGADGRRGFPGEQLHGETTVNKTIQVYMGGNRK